MDRVLKSMINLTLAAVLIAGIICAPVAVKGYMLYQSVLSEEPVREKIDEIRSDEDYVRLENISQGFRETIIRSEDKRFRLHFGLDPLAIIRAAGNDILAGSFVEGGSTITQQLAKNLYFDFDKNFVRKAAEAFMAVRLERILTKDEILELYLNCIYFGEDCYGIREASAHYYGSSPDALSEDQSRALAYTIRCPEEYNPNQMKQAV
ncbi:MAG: biosynthetic peptidoglycan transglycosylase [Emergencia sp.]